MRPQELNKTNNVCMIVGLNGERQPSNVIIKIKANEGSVIEETDGTNL
jgi:hypothetical protein